MKTMPNIKNWHFLKLHKPNFNFKNLKEHKYFFPSFSEYAIQVLQPGKITSKQLESCRKVLRRGLGKNCRIIFPIQIVHPISKKSVASRMGKGKGAVAQWIAVVKTGKVIVEVWSPLSATYTFMVITKAINKLPIKAKIYFSVF